MSATLIIAVALALPASELDRGVSQLVRELELPAVAGFSLSADVALAVTGEGKNAAEARAVERIVGGLLRGKLAAVGLTSVLELPAAATTANIEHLARGEGAEWMLAVAASAKSGKLSLHAELRRIDLGLWSLPPPKVLLFATADRTIEIEEPLKPLPAAVNEAIAEGGELGEGLNFDGAPQRIAAIGDRVLAMASCELGAPIGEALFVLTRRSLIIYLYSSTGDLRKAGALELASLERAKERVREPFGTVVCAAGGKELAFGSSELKDGQVVRLRAANHEVAMSIARAIPGLPVGELSPGKWALAHADAGKSRLSAAIEVDGTIKTLDAPVYELAIGRGRALAVGDRYRLIKYSAELEAPVVIGTSGVGISVIGGATELAVTTSSVARDRDRLRLVPLDRSKKERRASVEIDGAVSATAVARLGAEQRAVIAAAYRDGRTELYAVPLRNKGSSPR